MKAVSRSGAAFLGLSSLVLLSCADGTGQGQRGFEAQYNSARTALEQGNYDKAGRLYARLLPQSGALENRIQLEYAHTMLRAGEFTMAAKMANAVAQADARKSRAAALSVKGTAEHEMGLARLNAGDTRAGIAHLKAAHAALDEVLNQHPDLDPLGSLAGRRASIDVRLKSLQ